MKSEHYPSVWNTIANTTEEAGNLRVRTELLEKIDAIVTEAGWTQARCGVTQPRE